jgi:hypothetical protein
LSYLKDRIISLEKQLIKAQEIQVKLTDNLNGKDRYIIYFENRLPDMNNMPKHSSIDKPLDEPISKPNNKIVDK